MAYGQLRWQVPVGALDGYAASLLCSASAARRAQALVASSQSLLDHAYVVMRDSGARIARADHDADED